MADRRNFWSHGKRFWPVTNRAFFAVAAGLAITVALILVMQILIATGEDVEVEPRDRINLTWTRPPQPPEPVVEPPPPERIESPQLPPEAVPGATSGGSGAAIGVAVAPPLPQLPAAGVTDINITDGPLINIFAVEPRYPAAAAVSGLEGVVIVQFDVSPMGTVENVVVVESTDRVFNKAAVAAAYRFKYKPKIVDGVPQTTQGVRQKFRFDLNR